MRVLQVLPSFDPEFGGPVVSGASVRAAYEHFANVYTIGGGLPAGYWKHPGVQAFRGHRVPFVPRPIATVSPAAVAWFRRALGRDEYDFVHFHMNRAFFAAPLVAIAMRRQTPFVVQTHGMCAPWHGWKRPVDVMFTRRAIRSARAVFTLTSAEIERMRSFQPFNGVVLPNAVPEEEPLDRRTPVPPFKLLFCSRLHNRKGLNIFIDVCERLRRYNIPTVGLVAGADEGARASSEARVASLELDVRFLGQQSTADVRALMHNADILLHPAPREPFGMSMLQACSRGLPVVAAASSDLADVFEAYAAVALAPDEDIDAWAGAVIHLLRDAVSRDRQISNARSMVRQEFSIMGLSNNLYANVHPFVTGTK